MPYFTVVAGGLGFQSDMSLRRRSASGGDGERAVPSHAIEEDTRSNHMYLCTYSVNDQVIEQAYISMEI